MKSSFLFFLKLIAAIIMLETLFFKFTGAQESIYLFTKIAAKNETYMRIGIGILELLASILLFIPKTVWLGSLLAIGLMFGAIFSHLTILGIEFNNDGGVLFYSAIITFIASVIIFYNERKNIPFFGESL